MNLDIGHYHIDIGVATQIASLGFGVPISEALSRDVSVHLNEGKRYVVRDRDLDCEIGFATFRQIDDVLYLGGFMLLPGMQG